MAFGRGVEVEQFPSFLPSQWVRKKVTSGLSCAASEWQHQILKVGYVFLDVEELSISYALTLFCFSPPFANSLVMLHDFSLYFEYIFYLI